MSTQSSAASLPVSTDAAAQARLKALPQSAQKKYEQLRRVELRTKALNDTAPFNRAPLLSGAVT